MMNLSKMHADCMTKATPINTFSTPVRDQYTVSFEGIGPMTLKKQSGIKYAIGEISNWVTKMIMLRDNPEAARRAFEANGWASGSNSRYIGLTPKDSKDIDDFKDEITKAKIYYVSYVLDKKCINEFQRCAWTDENVRKFLEDMIKIGRLYQEKTIDYAKKISFLDIVPSPMRFVTLLSLKPMTIQLCGESIEISLPQFEDDDDHIVVNDLIHKARVSMAEEYKEYIETTVIPELNEMAKLPKEMDDELQRLRYEPEVSAFIEMKQYYKDIVGGYMRVAQQDPDNEDESIDVAKEAFASDKARIENMIRMATRYMSAEQRGAYMKYIAGRTKNNEKREDGTENRFYLALCREEFLKWLISLGLNEIDYAGYKLLGNKGYEDGDVVWFDNGQAGQAIIDGQYTGALTIKDVDGALYGTVDIADLINVPEADNRIIVKVQQGFVSKYGANKVVKALNMAQTMTFKADRKNWTLEIPCNDGKTRNIPYDLGKTFFSMFKDMTGSIVKVSKNTVKTMTGGTIESVYVSIDLDEMPEVMMPVGSSAVTEELIDIEVSDEI